MILTGEISSTLRETSSIAAVSTTDLTLSALRSKLKFVNEKPATYHVINAKITSCTSFAVVTREQGWRIGLTMKRRM